MDEIALLHIDKDQIEGEELGIKLLPGLWVPIEAPVFALVQLPDVRSLQRQGSDPAL